MKRAFVLFLASVLAVPAWAQDQLVGRLNHPGLIQIMRMALKYNQGGGSSPGFKIPAGLYSFEVKRSELMANPVVQLLNEVSDIDLTRDLPFYVTNANVLVGGEIDEASLRTAVSNYSEKGFDLKASFTVKSVVLSTPDISLCEKKNRAGTRCAPGIKASFKNVRITLKNGGRIKMSTDFRVTVQGEQARLKLVKATSNLGTRQGPGLNISIGQVVIPPISIVINGQEAQMDTSGLTDEILAQREFLGQKLLTFAGEFIAEDLAEMVNKALEKQCLPTRLRVLEMGQDGDKQLVHAIETFDEKSETPLMELLQRDLATIIKSAKFDLSLKSLRTPGNQDLEVRANGALAMNGQRWQVRNTLGNSARTLPAINLDALVNRQDHLVFALGEPVLNASLDLLSGVGVFQKVLDAQAKVPGLYVNSLKTHFKSGATQAQDRIYAVANLRVNLREMPADGIWAWIQRAIAVWLESDNNNANLRFPIQLEIIPRLVTQAGGTVKLMMRLNSPFASETALRNDYGYANDVVAANSMVRNAILKQLRDNMGAYVDREFEFPLDAYLSQKGVTIQPKAWRLVDSAYLMVSADMTKLDFAAMNQGESRQGCQ